MSPARQKQIFGAGALLVAAGVLGFIAYGGMEENLVYFWDVDQLLEKADSAKGATIRLGGVVQEGSYRFDDRSLDLTFTIAMQPTDSPGVAVHAKGQPPQMFREGIGVVVEGIYDGKAFNADRVIVKHSNEYQPPAEGERPQDLYKTLVDES